MAAKQISPAKPEVDEQLAELQDEPQDGDAAASAGQVPGAPRFVQNPDDLPPLAALGTPAALAAVNGDRRWLSEIARTRAELDAQPKVAVRLPQRRAPKAPLPPVTVQINDYTYQIPRGVMVHVPETVHLHLDEGGYLDVD